MSGTISYSDDESSLFAQFTKNLYKASDLAPPAMIVRINSPGGTVGASQALYDALLKMRARGIKVVALMEDVAASGGFYLAMGADKVIAHPGTVTGSIGVIMQSYEYSKVLEALGVNVQTVKSGPFKDTMSPARPMRPDEQDLLQGLITDTYAQFCDVIATARGLSLDTVHAFADGRIMTGRQAARWGLVDQLGSLDDAQRTAEKLAGLPPGQSRLLIIVNKQPFLRRFRLLGGARAWLERALPEAALSGLPLWLLPRR
ncbi:hypothetical protein A3C96_04295 [Candidatus Uhrbacteria bacterium RIFCSPHIGHO2_02_FULL_60_10]|uniref:Peptidase S49 domain-containing protein n=1 Tax=Candidatus Uhrbacteria bacterium RIFCSPHIGHO2_02_FULL_60_10 TaxID=1802392 RepID=A0A1F7U8S8_9BACT|nr:MAG: hypothetical protein A3C96_04295 [Candidatus Uhrbacteria bacterium RIFCSPHIGHO2_02_FULL_60_10]